MRQFPDSLRGVVEVFRTRGWASLVGSRPIYDPADVRVNDVVLVAWKGGVLLHLVEDATDDWLLIGNNLGKVNGWVDATAPIGRGIAVEE